MPLPITACLVSAVTWRLARPPVLRQLEYSRWKYLFSNSVAVGTIDLLCTFINTADYMSLGLAKIPDASIGAYVFGYNIAMQPLRVFALNVPIVLFPGLSHMSLEPARQVSAALRAMR